MGCCCKDKKDGKNEDKKQTKQTPDCMASKSTVVTTQDGDDVEVHFNMGTGEVTYGSKKGCCSGKDEGKTSGGCGCKK